MARSEKDRRRAEKHRSDLRRQGREAKASGSDQRFDAEIWSKWDEGPPNSMGTKVSDARQRALQHDSPSREHGEPVDGADRYFYWWQSARYGLVLVLDVHGFGGGPGLSTNEWGERYRLIQSLAFAEGCCKHIAIVHGHHERHGQITWKELVVRRLSNGVQLNPGVTIARIR